MRNPLQDQLLKAGLVKKSKVTQVVREQTRQRQGKAAPDAEAQKVDARRLQAERAERDRALAAERNADARAAELRAQVRQIVAGQKVCCDGDIAYAFEDGGRIKQVWVDAATRAQLIAGALVIARHDDGYALVPRAAAEKVRARLPGAIVLDHARTDTDRTVSDDDEHYRQFPVPDDLVW